MTTIADLVTVEDRFDNLVPSHILDISKDEINGREESSLSHRLTKKKAKPVTGTRVQDDALPTATPSATNDMLWV